MNRRILRILLRKEIIFGAIDYAQKLGFDPHPDFKLAREVLENEPITSGILGQQGFFDSFIISFDCKKKFLEIKKPNLATEISSRLPF